MKIILSKIIKTTFLLVIIFLSGCNLSTNPVVTAGNRDYTWTIDTLGRPTIDDYDRIWGSSPADVWAISGYSYPPNNIIHYDGSESKAVGPYKNFIAHSIWGFSPNNIWIGDGDGRLFHYDGNVWQKEIIITKVGDSLLTFDRMWGKANTLYAFGAAADNKLDANIPIVVQVRNGEWKLLNTTGFRGIIANLFVGGNKKVYIQNIQWQDLKKKDYDSTQIYEYDGNKFNRLYSSAWLQGKTCNISLINGKVYFVLGYKIAERVNGKFKTVFEINNSEFYGQIWGRTEKDIFLEMIDGIAHYNGSDIKYFHHFNSPKTMIYNALLFNDEVFFLVYDYPTKTSLLYHGKLKKGG